MSHRDHQTELRSARRPARSARRSRNKLRTMRLAGCLESLEERTLLSLSIPNTVDPSQASQVLFAGDLTHEALPAGTSTRLWEFSLNSASNPQSIEFDLSAASASAQDGALGLYDRDGNLLASANLNADPAHPGTETLSAPVQSGQPYIVGIFLDSSGVQSDFQLDVTPTPQTIDAPITADLSTGGASLAADSGETLFQSPADVEVYPLSLPNGAGSGSVTVTPSDPNANLAATLFRRNDSQSPWVPIDSKAGPGAVVLTLTPPPGGNLADAQYRIATAPLGFTAAAGTYQIDVASATLAPTSVDPATALPIGGVFFPSVGTARNAFSDTLTGAAKIYHYHALTTGPATFTVNTTGFAPLVNIYDSTGTQLLKVASNTAPGSVSFQLPLTAGNNYLVRIDGISGTPNGNVDFSIDTTYTAAPVNFNANNVALVGNLAVGTTAGTQFFRITPGAGFDILALEIDGTSSSPGVVLSIAGPDLGNLTVSAQPGLPLYLPLVITSKTGPFDIAISGTGDGSPVALHVGRLSIPKKLDPAQLASFSADLTGHLSQALTTAASFGSMAGLKYYQFLTNPTDKTQISAQGSAGSRPVVARYQYVGGSFQLVDFSTPDASNQSTLYEPLIAQSLQGIATFSLGFDTSGSPATQVSVAAPAPVPVGVGMAPNNPPPLPTDPPNKPQNTPFVAQLKIDGITLNADYQQDLYKTILPYNLVFDAFNLPVLTFTPATPNAGLEAKITVYRADTLAQIGTAQSAGPGATVKITLYTTAAQMASFINAPLLILVQPLTNHLGDGIYSLDMNVRTKDPRPFLVTQDVWQFHPAGPTSPKPLVGAPDVNANSSIGVIPAGVTITDILQNQYGNGSADGQFTSSDPNSAATYSVYRFWTINPGPIVVRTVALQDSPTDPVVNTNLRVYRGLKDSNGQFYLDRLTQVLPNSKNDVPGDFDWYPASRLPLDPQSEANHFLGLDPNDPAVDAQVFLNNPDVIRQGDPGGGNPYGTGGGSFYIVVRNQEGSQGKFRIEVDTPSFPLLGGAPDSGNTLSTYQSQFPGATSAVNNQLTYLNEANGGSAQLHLNYVAGFTDFVGYFPIQIPANHTGPFTVTAPSLALTDTLWDLSLFDASGQPITGTSSDVAFGFAKHTVANFQVPSGEQLVYLRVKERNGDNTPNNAANLTVSTSLTSDPQITPPPSVLPAGENPVLLPTDPMGNAIQTASHDATFHDSYTRLDPFRSYTFRAPAGPLSVTVTPDANSVKLLYSIYAGTNLIGWGIANAGTPSTTTVTLPKLRQPTDDSAQYGYDRSTYQVITVRVQALNVGLIGHTFTVGVATTATLPMRDQSLQVSPLTGSLGSQNTTGLGWSEIQVPEGITGSFKLFGIGSNLAQGGETVRYDLYDYQGNFVSSGTQLITSVLPVATFTIPQVVGGQSYFVRMGLTDRPSASVNMTASATLPKATGNHAKPQASINLNQATLITAPVDPDGSFAFFTASNADDVLWVDQRGLADFKMFADLSPNSYIALYRINYAGHGEDINEWELDLVDFLNRTDVPQGQTYDLSADLEPGAYVFKAVTTVTEPVNGELPNYMVHQVVIDPSTGSAEYPNLESTDTAEARDRLVTAYRTSFYEVVAPAGALGEFQAKAKNRSLEDSYVNGKSNFYVYVPSGNTFTTLTSQAGDVSTLDDPTNKADQSTPAQLTYAAAKPFQPFYISLGRQFVASEVGVTADFAVPLSGTPDLVVAPLVLTADGGQTLVTVTIRNNGFGKASATSARYAYSDASKPANLMWTTSLLNEDSLGPLGTRTRTFIWNPLTPNDMVEYASDWVANKPNGKLEEADETNNGPFDLSAPANGMNPRMLKEVDANPPVVVVDLSNTKLEGPQAAQNIWGRYVSGVNIPTEVDFTFSDPDGQQDLYSAYGHYPSLYPPVKSPVAQYLSILGLNTAPTYALKNFDTGLLFPTAPDNPNQINIQVTDQWGLKSQTVTKTFQVVAKPGWLNNSESTITFDEKKLKYNIHFHHTILNEEGTLNDLLNTSLPLVGDKQNQLLAEVDAVTTATLDPTAPVAAPVTAHAKLELLGSTIFDEQWKGNAAPADHFTISTNVQIDRMSLDAKFFEITFKLTNLPLASFASPEIPLFAYGIPGIADIEADLQFLFSASLDAAVTLGIDPAALSDPTKALDLLGLASPTFVQPNATVGAKVSGNVKVLGFDIASLSGTVDVGLHIAYGLTTPHDQLVPFGDFFSDSGFKVSGELYGVLEADFLGIKIFSYETPHIQLFSAGNVVTSTVSQDDNSNMGTSTVPKGSDPVGPIGVDPSPQMVIDPRTGQAMYVQVVDVGSAGASRGNLAFSRRVNGTWTTLTTIPQAGYVTNPVLAETNDLRDTSAPPDVVVYQAADLPPNATENQYFTSQDIRYRYFNGLTWGPELSLTANTLQDTDPAVSFNTKGQGVAAWVHNTNPNPVGDDGEYDRSSNEIQIAVWDKVHHTFSTPVTLTSDNVADGQPTVLAGDDGTLRVAWVRDTAGGGNEVWYSTFDGTNWSAPAALKSIGVPTGGSVQDLTMAEDGAGKIHTLMAVRGTNADGTANWNLLDRISPQASWTAPTSLETVATGARFSHLKMVRDAKGVLVAYWQKSNGIDNNDWGARFDPNPQSGKPAWSQPFELTNNPDAATDPTVAIDTDGRLQVAYDHVVPLGSQPAGAATDISVAGLGAAGSVMTSSVKLLPELSFTRAMSFPYHDLGASGTQVNADAQIINRGLIGDNVTIQYYNGIPSQGGTMISSQTIYLSPGQTYDVTHPFLVLPGAHQYSIQLVAEGGQEIIGTADNVSTATLTGMADLTVRGMTLSDAAPHSGEVVTVTATVQNLSDQPVSSFDVSLTQGNPAHAFETTVPIGTQNVASLGAFGQKTVSFQWTVPAGAGYYNLTALVDSANVIPEAVETNNDGHADVSVVPDATITNMTATLLDKSGKNNVSIAATIANNGEADLQNVQLTLLWSLNDGPFKVVGSKTIASLAHMGNTVANFTAYAFAGNNRYRLLVDPSSAIIDFDRSNNFADRTIDLQGLPDLTVTNLSLGRTTVPQGTPLTVNANITNAGIASADNVVVELYDGKPGTGKFLRKLTIPTIDPLATVPISFPINTSQLGLGTHQFWVVVDRKALILETSDLNNSAFARVNVVSPDHIAPSSNVTLLPAIEPTPKFTVAWSGKDIGGAGIAFYDIYASTDGAPAVKWLTHTTATTALYTGKPGHTYSFYSVATDAAGNHELAPKAPDTKTKVDVAPTITKSIVDKGLSQRSYVDQFQLNFSKATNIQTLLNEGQLVPAISLMNLGVNATTSTPTPVTLTPGQFRYDPKAMTLTWSLESFGPTKTSLPDGYYELKIDTTKIKDAFGAQLDGDRDGLPGGTFVLHFHRLLGDANGDMTVTNSTAPGSDVAVINAALGSVRDGKNWNINADLNRDGAVNAGDQTIVNNNAGHAIVLPKATTASAASALVSSITPLPSLPPGPSPVDGSGYAVAVIDTGIDYNLPALAGRVILGPDFADNDSDPMDTVGHGTAVAGLIASGDDQAPGIAPGAKLIALKVTPDGSNGAYLTSIEEALQWVIDHQAADHIAAVNLSLSSGAVAKGHEPALLEPLFKQLAAEGVFVTAAAGNDYTGPSGNQGVSILAASPEVVAVGAISTSSDQLAPFTQRGPGLNLLAPGTSVAALTLSGSLAQVTGTSLAAPIVAGASVLIREAADRMGVALAPDQILELLERTGTPITDTSSADLAAHLTYERINLAAALDALDQEYADAPAGTVIPLTAVAPPASAVTNSGEDVAVTSLISPPVLRGSRGGSVPTAPVPQTLPVTPVPSPWFSFAPRPTFTPRSDLIHHHAARLAVVPQTLSGPRLASAHGGRHHQES